MSSCKGQVRRNPSSRARRTSSVTSWRASNVRTEPTLVAKTADKCTLVCIARKREKCGSESYQFFRADAAQTAAG